MVMQRTPRKDKMWIGRNASLNFGAGDLTQVAFELLSAGLSDMGVSRMSKVTVMRIFGSIRLIGVSGATTPAAASVDWGIAWVSENIANAAEGDGQIPQPMVDGLRETTWLQQGNLLGLEPEAPLVAALPLEPLETSIVNVDITQQRKQPTVDSRLVLITEGPINAESGTVAIDINLQIMLALA